MTVTLQPGNLLVMSNGNITLQYNLTAGTVDCFWQSTRRITAFYAGVGLNTGYVKGLAFSNRTYTVTSTNEVVVSSGAAGLPAMTQHFILDQTDSFLTRVDMSGASVSANWMGPVVVDTAGGVDLGSYTDGRALFVPFDNDHFIRYNAMPLNSSGTSYEVGAFYDNASRIGLVVGSITHDTWKSGVYWSGANNKLDKMNVFGGAVSPSVTWDVLPHGFVSGSLVSSPTIFVGFGADWRRTLEAFADANARLTPMLPWTNGVPFGWNSWGYYQSHINYSLAIGVSDSIHTNLQPFNFNNHGAVYVNLDSYWDNMTDTQLAAFASHCHANGQRAGIYWSPFVWWGSSVNASNAWVEGTANAFHYSDVLLRTPGGNYETNDGALAMDLTHPGTQERISYYIDRFLNAGFDYIKVDFLSHGALEGVHYNSAVTTGIQAYNQGMRYLLSRLNGHMFISESIAPLFPYQYAQARRIACDAQSSRISDTAYTMNSVTYGWWLGGRLYAYNDPDVMVFGNGASLNENESRVICGAITGLFLDGDSLSNSASIGAAQLSLTNAALDALARGGHSFSPTEGNTGSNPADVFEWQDGSSWYLAVFNYNAYATNKVLSLIRAGITGNVSPLDLWSGAVLPLTNSLFSVSLNADQAKIFRLRSQPRLLHSQSNGPQFIFDVQGDPDTPYAIQETSDLAAWSTLGFLTNVTGLASFTDAVPAGVATRAYRARLVP